MSSSKQQTQTQTNSNTNYNQSTSPWGPQQSAIEAIYGQLPGAYAQSSSATLPANFTATMTPQQLAVYQAMVGTGQQGIAEATGVGGAAGNAAGAGYGGATTALGNLNNYNPTTYTNAPSVLDTARQYVNGVDIPGQVKAAMQSATEEARDVTNPGIVNDAASTGNVNSSRTDLAQGLVDRALAEQAGNLSATLGNQAWQTGTQLGTNLATANQTANLDAIVAALGGGTALASSGNTGLSGAVNDAMNSYNLQGGGAAGNQQNNQLAMTNALQQFLYGTQAPYQSLDQAANLAMNGNWGSNTSGQSNTTGSSNSTTTTTPSAFQIIGGLLGAGGSMMTGLGSGGLGWTPLKTA